MSQDNIIQLDFSEEMKTSYRDYAVSVIRARALPDVRDGLKPVQRRILYAMKELGLSPDKPHRKSARIVGDTMGKYHPHGDSSIYDALVHMTEEYSLNLPLVDGHGNFGSIDGDGAAAMRYTEARLSPAAMTMLDNLEKGLVEFDPNFDESEKEPQVLPAMVPNLLINGTTGIAVGMATNIPTHNPGEVIDAVIACMDRPGISVQKLMDYIPGPDFPTGGIITNASELANIYETGEGKIKVRAKTVIEKGDNGRTNIVITEIPYTVSGNKTKLVESISGLMKATDVIDLIIEILRGSSSVKQAKSCLIEGKTEGIRFKTEGAEEQAKTLLFTEIQADAILSMQLSKLIGLEILKLHEENETLLKNIEEYEKILSDTKELYKVIKTRLRSYKKMFARERRTELTDDVAKAYVEEVKVEDVCICLDRFGYAKCLDAAAFGRASDDAKKEFAQVVMMKSTDKLCLFTNKGNMHQIKCDKIPRCKMRDKGTLVHNLCKMTNDEDALLYISFEQLFESMLFFSTKSGFVKLVSGAEFETNRLQVAATKLDEGDEVSGVTALSAADILAGGKKVILLTKKGLSLGFPLEEVSEFKKTSRGVKGIALEKEDTIVHSTIVDLTQETFEYDGKTLDARHVRNRKRAAKGQKANLEWKG